MIARRRSLHTAEDAVDTKWVTQQWVARGLASRAAARTESSPAGSQQGQAAAAAAAAAQSQGASQSSTTEGQARRPPLLKQRGEEAPVAVEVLLAGKRGKGKKAGKKAAGKGFGG